MLSGNATYHRSCDTTSCICTKSLSATASDHASASDQNATGSDPIATVCGRGACDESSPICGELCARERAHDANDHAHCGTESCGGTRSSSDTASVHASGNDAIAIGKYPSAIGTDHEGGGGS